MRSLIRSFWLVLVVTHGAVQLPAQSTKAELSGFIRDPMGLAVEGADVRLLNMGTDLEQSVLSGPDGQYHFRREDFFPEVDWEFSWERD